jgi:predicted RNA methylase
MAAVYVINLVIDTGTDFNQTFELELSNQNQPVNLSEYTVSSQMRKYAGSTNAINFTTSITPPGTSGVIGISLSSEQTLGIKSGRYVYDIVIDDGEIKTKVVEGMVLVREGVTR